MSSIEPARSTPKIVPPVMSGAILCTIDQAVAMIARSRRFIYDAIATGQIRAVKSDARTLVVVDSLREYAAGLSAPKFKPMGKKVA